MSEQTIPLGFKKLTLDNWKLPDPANDYFVRLNFQTGEESKISDDERVEKFLKIELESSVPIDVRRQFETARGAMLYGCFFYPLFALGIDQLLRVAESAVTHKCSILRLTKDKARYEVKLQKLKNSNHLVEKEYEDWEDLRKLRNDFSHSKFQTIFPSFNAVFFLKHITDKINKLFQPART